MHDLVLRAGRIVDPARGHDAVGDIAFSDGRVAEVGTVTTGARDERDVTGMIVTPGIIDLHTHVYWGGTSLGVDPDSYAKPNGITTVVDAGSAGAGNFKGLRKHIIEPAEVRILPFLHIAFPGIFALSRLVNRGESADLTLLDCQACLEVAREHADIVVGIKVRLGRGGSGNSGIAPMEMALEVAEQTGLPLMTHLDYPPPYRPEVMPRLRKGDILTHCFRPFPNSPVAGDGAVQADVLAARERGVIFDIGHGKGSFGFETAMTMLGQGFLPDVISSDVHALSIDGPAFNMLNTMSKFLAMDVPLVEIVRASTINAARAIRLTDRGTFEPGLLGDATVLDIETGTFTFEDVVGKTIEGSQNFVCRGAVLDGRWWH
ncbi:amidohydrolase/deacetylase family metallohydrolase [Marinivivus vitaminiproducens]|uniref:amidohydrolase/deacetylase family metallohydrolase n=1 Tax=Marinivivus vitaminiproducens TaxID=3035935 RepID=UPI0027A5B99C|nr:amidohydrolase/deacetylase family metallohydrolase [Geminicoccaceae bacterium SCSIO 64248]